METKGLTFGKSDKELVEKIVSYQHKKQLPFFVEAVRRLCGIALEIEKLQDKQ